MTDDKLQAIAREFLNFMNDDLANAAIAAAKTQVDDETIRIIHRASIEAFGAWRNKFKNLLEKHNVKLEE